MKFFNNIFLMAGALALCSVGFSSCSDDDTYDFPGDPYNKVYMKDYSTGTKIVQTPVGAIASFSVSMPAVCKSPAEGDINVVVGVDNSLIDAYNEENGTNYSALPAEALVITNEHLVIPKGETSSAEEFVLALTEDEATLATLQDLNGYLVPVKMVSVSGGNAQAAVSVPSISYFTIGVGFDVCDPDATKDNRKGRFVEDRSGWTVALDGNGSVDGNPADWFSGSGNVCTFSDPEQVAVIVDLGKAYKFDGIYSGYLWYGYYEAGTFTQGSKVYLSSDKKTWMEVYECEGGGWLGDDFIGFYGAMEARYIKITAVNPYLGQSWASYYSAEIASADFNIYATN